jgi:hypothetical protein
LKFRSLAIAGAIVLALASGTVSVSVAQTQPQASPTPTPPPAPIFTPPPTPPPVPSTAPERGRGRGKGKATPAPDASDTPEPPQFATMDGVWEVALQPLSGARAVYSHLYVTQKGDTLTGTWLREDGKTKLPFTGTFDGRLFTLTVTDGAKAYKISGYAENFGDMVGLIQLDPSKDGVPFTASHRKKDKLER